VVKKNPDDQNAKTGSPATGQDDNRTSDPAPAETSPHPPITSEHKSDVELADCATLRAPSFPSPPPASSLPVEPSTTIELQREEKRPRRGSEPMALLPGAKVDDFEIVRLLGRGAFGHVYLARQISLDRQVALKISANRGSEGRTMARLEHQHIVQVFSETVDPDFNQRLLCMQLVPGIGLDKLIGMLHAKEETRIEEQGGVSIAPKGLLRRSPISTRDWTGAQLLANIDSSASLPTALDPAALHDREALGRMDSVEATAWFGARLAEALDFAHRHGVLHRDIKPANILVNPYGRPMLADFNISSQPIGSEQSGEEIFGGTFAYMAPEHLDAFNPDDSTGRDAVTARSDLYSLGLVLQQMLDGRISVPLFRRSGKLFETLRQMSDERRRPAPICSPGQPSARMTLERTMGRCLEPNPDDRFPSGAELAEQLDGCRRLRDAERQLPRVRAIYTPALKWPFLLLIALVILPQMAASAVNIAYNLTQIVVQLNDEQQSQFWRLVNGYNAIVYPIAIVAFVLIVRPVWKCWNELSSAARLEEGEVKTARRRALRLPRWIAGLTALGWFPGGFLFPALIPGVSREVVAHFVASFCLSGLIALAYSLCGVEFVVLRVLYPGLWRDVRNFNQVARAELAPVHGQLNRIEILAGSIPLIAAILTLFLLSNATMKILVAALIVLGMIGARITSAITRHMSQVIVAFTNTKA
jgi:eukaryotic-like serine/threonine-protein kinase